MSSEVTCKTTFAELLATMLRERGMSQAALARALGLDHSTVCRYVGGSRYPSRRRAMAMADLFGLTGDERREFLAIAGYAERT